MMRFLLCSWFVLTATSAAAQPDIVLIICDDAGYVDFGFQGTPGMPTPALDALARGGVVCTQAYVTAGVCSPSRAGLITGRYQQRFGHHHNLRDPHGLPLSQATMADHLGAAGYHTAAFGKWHLGAAAGYEPTARGFDTFVGLLGGSRSYWPLSEPSRNHALRRGMAPIEETFDYFTTWLGREAVAFLGERTEAAPEQPVFVYLSYTAPHSPMHAPASYLERFAYVENGRRQAYLAMTQALDDSIADVLAALEARGRETLIVFVNDNGGATSNGSDNGLLRGMKGSQWEGGLRVPMVVHWPGELPAFTTYGRPVSTLDLLPTFLAAAGAEALEGSAALDGVDLTPYLRGEDLGVPHETLFWKRSTAEAVRHGDWKLIRIDDGYRVLINLAADPGETINQLDAHPAVAAELEGLLEDWVGQTVEPLWWEGDPWEQYVRDKHRMGVRGREAERRLP